MLEAAEDVFDAVGGTPLVRLQRVAPAGAAEVLAKIEALNPSGSAKDRGARAVLARGEAAGALRPGRTLVEATSGSMGIALALRCARKGYRFIAVVPEGTVKEVVALLRAHGAEVETAADMRAAVERAKRLAQDEGAFYGGQLEGAAAEPSLAEEVAAQLGGEPDAVVACVGSGATFLGLRARFPRARAVAVVSGPPVAGAFAEDAEALRVAPADARAMRARLAREEGILAGLSSGAAAVGAVEVARELGAGRRVVTVFADTGERYFSLEAR